jgi:hypothetical protein
MGPFMPHRLELKPGRVLFPWLQSIAQKATKGNDDPT